MKENANKIVLGVAAALVVLMVALAVGSGSCSGGGGGAATGQTAGGSQASASGGSATAGGESATASASSESQAVTSKSGQQYEELRDQLRAELSQGATTGSNERSASASGQVTTVAQTHADIEQRGFGNVELSASFAIDGTYLGMQGLDSASGEKYPSYRMTYLSPSKVEWLIVVNDGRVLAVPTGSAGVAISKEMVFSETDTVVQYDGTKNTYSDFSLSNMPGAVGVQVTRIDKATLDSYTPHDLETM